MRHSSITHGRVKGTVPECESRQKGKLRLLAVAFAARAARMSPWPACRPALRRSPRHWQSRRPGQHSAVHGMAWRPRQVVEITLAQGGERDLRDRAGKKQQKVGGTAQHIPKAKNNPHKKPCDSPPIPTNHEITPICAALRCAARAISFHLPPASLCRPACTTVHGGGRCCMRAWAASLQQPQQQPGSESEGIPTPSRGSTLLLASRS